jgi:hypothetical protein
MHPDQFYRGVDDRESKARFDRRERELAAMPKRLAASNLSLEAARSYPHQYDAHAVLMLGAARVSPEMCATADIPSADWVKIAKHDRKFARVDEYRNSPARCRHFVDQFYRSRAIPCGDALLEATWSPEVADALVNLAGTCGVKATLDLFATIEDDVWFVEAAARFADIDLIAAAWASHLEGFTSCESCSGSLGEVGQHCCPFKVEIYGSDEQCGCCDSCTRSCAMDI